MGWAICDAATCLTSEATRAHGSMRKARALGKKCGRRSPRRARQCAASRLAGTLCGAGALWRAMMRIELYRDCAAECLLLAGSATTSENRARLIDMAAKWHELADMMEKLVSAEQSPAGESRPATSQVAQRPH